MGCCNVTGGHIVITEHPVTDDISGNAPLVIHGERHGSKHQNVRTGSFGVMPATKRNAMEQLINLLPALRFEISEASRILRMSRAQLYHRIGEGAIRIQKKKTARGPILRWTNLSATSRPAITG
jgi:transcriptional regulator of acetoin/glycerol metabolism